MSEAKILQLNAGADDAGKRLDRFVSDGCEELSRSYIKGLIADGNIYVNREAKKPSYLIEAGDEVVVNVPPPVDITPEPEDIPLDILYEDNDIIIVNKPKGMVVHPAAGHSHGTLVNALLYYCKDSLSGINGVIRPGIVHRIDADTTGSLVVCKNDSAHRDIAAQIAQHSINRIYEGFVYGNIKEDTGRIDEPIGRHPKDRKKMAVVRGGKEAITEYRVLERFPSGRATHMEFKLYTGRTHQIRVHMAHIGHPLLGDTVYGSAKNPYHLQGQALHARLIGFVHPATGEYMEIEAQAPDYFEALRCKLMR